MENEGLFKEMVENSNDIRIVADQHYKIRYISSSVTKVFGVDPIKLLGADIFTFISPDKIESWRVNLLTSTSFNEEFSLIYEGKEVHFDVQVSNLLNRSSIRGFFLKLHDVTARKFKEQELIRSNKQLDQVIYKTTHDLKAPLRSAMGLVNLAEKAPVGEKDRYLALIKKSLLKLDSFIEEMNNFFRNEKLALQRDKLNIVELLSEELDNLHSLHEEHRIDIRFDVRENTAFYSDSIRVRTVITNILSNAIKYSDPGKAEPFILIFVSVNGEFCEIRISDNGIGIDPQYQKRIFDLFFRATNHSQGTGLGLFIVKDTVEKLQGRIEVNSTLGEGTSFSIRIPNQINQPIAAG